MKKFGIVAGLILCQFAWVGSASAAMACEAHVLDDHLVIVRIGPRIVTLIGWEHLDDSSSETLISGLKASYEAAKGGKCDEASQHAGATLRQVSQDLKSARTVFDRISQANKEAALSSIGVEMTPFELDDQWKLNIRLNEVFSELQNFCDIKFRAMAAQLRVMIPGPDFEFHRLNANIPIKALEDQSAKDANEKDFDGAEQDTFDYQNPAMTPEAKAAIETLRQDLMKQVAPSELTIQQAISFEKDPVRRAKLEAELRYSLKRGARIIGGAYKRNVAIAASIMSEQGNIAVPIGFRHVDNLVGEILKQCESK